MWWLGLAHGLAQLGRPFWKSLGWCGRAAHGGLVLWAVLPLCPAGLGIHLLLET